MNGKSVRVFVVWEPVLLTDRIAPTTGTLKRISDLRAEQFWDKDRLVSHSMGEHDRASISWDYVAVYGPGATWTDRPPAPVFDGGPVVKVVDRTREALMRQLLIAQ
jgi:hypothetical protein